MRNFFYITYQTTRAGKLPQLTPVEFTEPHLLPPLSKFGRKTPSTTTPPLEFTEPHLLPPLSKFGRKTPSTTPLEFTAGTEIRPPQIKFLDPPLYVANAKK